MSRKIRNPTEGTECNMRWNDFYDQQALAKLEREGYPKLFSMEEDRTHIKLMACMGRTGHPPMRHYSYAIFWLALGSAINLTKHKVDQVEWLHRDCLENNGYGWFNLERNGHPLMIPIEVSDLPLYIDLPIKSILFEKLLKYGVSRNLIG